MFFDEWPWQLFRSVDPREPEGTRSTLVAEFTAKSRCCVPFGFARNLKDVPAADLEGDIWQGTLLFAAWMVRASVAGVETLHARSRRLADPQMNWETFVSNFISEDAKAHVCQGDASPDDLPQLDGGHSTSSSPALPHGQGSVQDVQQPVPPAVWKRTQSALHLFHKKHLTSQQAAGRKINPASAAFWQEVREAFGELSQAEMEALTEESRAIKGLACAERRSLRAGGS